MLPKTFGLQTNNPCLEGREVALLAGGLIDTKNTPPKEGCAGYSESTKNDVGTYILGPYTFKVPRDYVIFGRYDEGYQEDNGLLLRVAYPSMKPVYGKFGTEEHTNSVKVYVKYNNACPEAPCEKSANNWYKIRAKRQNYKLEKTVHSSPVISELENFRSYTVGFGNQTEVDTVYFQGDIEKPQKWYFCKTSAPNPHCKTKYKIETGLWIELSFHYSNLFKHQDIRMNINSLINSNFRKKKP
jgi:hypothetical protein